MKETLRFLIRSAANGVVEVAWSKELDHRPVAVGVVQLRSDTASDDAIATEARRYVAEWERMNGVTV